MVADGPKVRDAAWVARCVGRHELVPLRAEDIAALAAELQHRTFEPGQVVFSQGKPSPGVWIVRAGLLELSAGTGLRRIVVQLLRPGDVDGDLQLLLGMPMVYGARAAAPSDCFFLPAAGFEVLLATHPAVSRRWLTSVASRLALSQRRLMDLLGRPLAGQLALLLLDEAADGVVPYPQSTLAAMLGVRRPSVNRLLKEWERDGLVALSYGQVRLVDPARLRKTVA